ncbi:hypothetical protein MKX03_020305 [Papaver bracteatum]|nr:hypothetical protein MKX03_020305 [Papaver bracteatum]
MATSEMNLETLKNLGRTENCKSKPHIEKPTKHKNWLIICINCAIVFCGVIGSPLLLRLYFLHGGSRKWLSSWIQTAGFPVLIIPLIFLYIRSELFATRNNDDVSSFFMEPRLFLASAAIGILYGVVNFMYALGLSNIPVSTSSILCATQLCFNAFFAWLIVKQKFTALIINAIVIMTLGSVLLGINSDGDRPVGVSKDHYLIGFLMTLGSAALSGVIMPMIQLAFSKAARSITYSTLLQFQITLAISANALNIIGMLINKDFQAIHREANEYELGKTKYYIILFFTAFTFQLMTMGVLGVILCTSALFNGIFISALIPFTQVAAVIFYHEKFTGLKGMSLALCLWGFCSYFYGEYKMLHKVANRESPEKNYEVKNEA